MASLFCFALFGGFFLFCFDLVNSHTVSSFFLSLIVMSVFCNVISLRFEELALAVSDGTTLDHEVQVFEAWKSN